MLNTILFDLDGTLAPFIQDEFVHVYFKALVKRLIPMGYDGERLVEALWKGVDAMVANDGTQTNRQRFWEVFTRELGIQALVELAGCLCGGALAGLVGGGKRKKRVSGRKK